MRSLSPRYGRIAHIPPITSNLEPIIKPTLCNLNTIRLRKSPSIINFNLPKSIPNFKPAKMSTHSSKNIYSFAANSTQGIIKKINEDRVSIILNFKREPYIDPLEYWPHISLFGIFDGHGGTGCAEFLKNNLYNYIIKNKQLLTDSKEAIMDAFLAAEANFITYSEAQSKIDKSGSCALIVLLIGLFITRDRTCYVANVGDSRAIMSQQGGVIIKQITTDHKPGDEAETKRIKAYGGTIYRSFQLLEIRPPKEVYYHSEYILVGYQFRAQ